MPVSIKARQMHHIMVGDVQEHSIGMAAGKLITKLRSAQVGLIVCQIVKHYVQDVMNSHELMGTADL